MRRQADAEACEQPDALGHDDRPELRDRSVECVGDGGLSTTVLATALFGDGVKLFAAGVDPRAIADSIRSTSGAWTSCAEARDPFASKTQSRSLGEWVLVRGAT